MPLASIIEVFQHTASDKLRKLLQDKKPHIRSILQDKVFTKVALSDFISLQSRLDHPSQFSHRAGLRNLIKHEMSQLIALIYADWIGPLGTHSARKGLLGFANVLSTLGHAFKEQTNTACNP